MDRAAIPSQILLCHGANDVSKSQALHPQSKCSESISLRDSVLVGTSVRVVLLHIKVFPDRIQKRCFAVYGQVDRLRWSSVVHIELLGNFSAIRYEISFRIEKLRSTYWLGGVEFT